MNEIFKKLSVASESGMKEYINTYTSNIKDILPLSANASILKSNIKTNDLSDAESLLRFSLVFNDLTFLTCISKNNICMPLKKEWFEDNFGSSDIKINVSVEENKKLGINTKNPIFYPSFIHSEGNEIDLLASKLRPFIESGKILLQPDRAILLLTKDGNPGDRTWRAINTNQTSSIMQWDILDGAHSSPIPLEFKTNDQKNTETIFEITIPYLEGINFTDLSKILEDEQDLVSSLRVSILQAINEIDGKVDANIVAKDIIDPKIDMLNRKFKLAVNSHAFNVAGAAIGTVALAYTSVATSGISSALTTIAGAGGVGMLSKEYSKYKERVNTLKEDPFYFLWKCKKHNK